MTIATQVKFTYDDLRLFPDDGKRHELIDGEHIMTPAPRKKHQAASINLATRFYNFVEPRKLGRVFTAPFDVVFSDYDTTEPDVIFISREREHILTEDNIQGAPDLLVEILSPSTMDIDRGAKLEIYQKYGVLEYWILDPDAKTIEIYVLRDRGFEQLGIFSGRQKIQSEVLRGFSCTANQVFEE